MARQAGWRRHLWFKKEVTWGTGVTPDIWLPYLNYDVKPVPQFFNAETHCGVRQRRAPNQSCNKVVSGRLDVPMYAYHVTSSSATKSIAQHLIDNVLSGPASEDQDSFTFNRADVTEGTGVEHDGMRVNQLTITGSPETKAIMMAFDFFGQAETTGITVPTLSESVPHPKAFTFFNAVLQLGGVTVYLRSIELTINNNLQNYFNNTEWVDCISQGRRMIDYKFGILKTANTYDALRRATDVTDQTASLVLKGVHDGSGSNTYTTLTIAIGRMNFGDAEDQVSLDGLDEQNVNYMVLKPNSSAADVALTWGTAS